MICMHSICATAVMHRVRAQLQSMHEQYLLVTEAACVLIDVARRQRRVQGQELRAVDAQRSLDRVGRLHRANVYVSRSGHGNPASARFWQVFTMCGRRKHFRYDTREIACSGGIGCPDALPCVTQH